MSKEFHQVTWDDALQADAQQIIRLAIREDVEDQCDWTSRALVPPQATGQAAVVARQSGVIAGLPAAEMALAEIDARLHWEPQMTDGAALLSGDRVALIRGPAQSLLTAERTVLNLLGRLSGIATLARRYVDAVSGTKARIYDTRKTTPGWRRLEKYAVRCGGASNHRTGLFEAVLIKDNHLAFGAASSDATHYTPAEAVIRARAFLAEHAPASGRGMIVEVEVDTLEQLDQVLRADPDIVLLDNMSPDQLREAVARRDAANPAVELEASGGVNLQTIRAIAESGVDRISVGALTHSAVSLDIALDWIVAI